MNVEMLSKFFLWCSIINTGALLFSFFVVVMGKKYIYRMHGMLFNISEEKIGSAVYSTLIHYKVLIFIFNIIPYIAIQIIK
ncbi:DUF6868 family protein [Candidatus Margulisiibacteriota bacterium]